ILMPSYILRVPISGHGPFVPRPFTRARMGTSVWNPCTRSPSVTTALTLLLLNLLIYDPVLGWVPWMKMSLAECFREYLPTTAYLVNTSSSKGYLGFPSNHDS